MQYKIYGTPKMLIRDIKKNKPLFRFNESGFFIVDETCKYLKKLQSKFKHELLQNEPIQEDKQNIKTEKKIIQCKQCDEQFDNMGKLLSHIRKCHKKEG